MSKFYIVRTGQPDEEVALLVEKWVNGPGQAEVVKMEYIPDREEWILIFRTED